jgi:hypothetical protein
MGEGAAAAVVGAAVGGIPVGVAAGPPHPASSANVTSSPIVLANSALPLIADLP